MERSSLLVFALVLTQGGLGASRAQAGESAPTSPSSASPAGASSSASSSAASSQAGTPAGRPVEELVKEAKAAFQSGEFQRAFEAYREAFERKPSHDIAGNLAQCEQKLGKHREAAQHLTLSLRLAPVSLKAETKKAMTEALGALKSKLIAVRITGAPPGCRATFEDGASEPLSDDPLFVDPNARKVVLSAPGFQSVTRTVEGELGQEIQVDIEWKAERANEAEKGPEGPKASEPKPVWPAALLGTLGGVLVAGGAGTLGGAFVMRDGVGEDLAGKTCTGGAEACADGRLDTANVLGAVGISALAVGAASLAGMGIYLALPSGEGEAGATEPAVSFGVTGSRLMVKGTF